MSNNTLVVAAELKAKDAASRDQIYGLLQKCAEYAIGQTSILKYAVCLPHDSKDDVSVYVFEEHVNQASIDSFMAAPPMVTTLGAASDLLATGLRVYQLSWKGDLLSRDDRLPIAVSNGIDARRIEKPFVIWAKITGGGQANVDKVHPYGQAVIENSQKVESDTIFYANASPRDGNSPYATTEAGLECALEVYASEGAGNLHLSNDSVKTLVKEGLAHGVKFEIVELTMQAGFLSRG